MLTKTQMMKMEKKNNKKTEEFVNHIANSYDLLYNNIERELVYINVKDVNDKISDSTLEYLKRNYPTLKVSRNENIMVVLSKLIQLLLDEMELPSLINEELNKLYEYNIKNLNDELDVVIPIDETNYLSYKWLNDYTLNQRLKLLNKQITQSLINSIKRNLMIQQDTLNGFKKTFDKQFNKIARIIKTESNMVLSKANLKMFKFIGVKKYEIVAVLDNRTSDICRSMNGRVFNIDDYEIGVTANPFHPNCRSTTVAIEEE